MSTPGDTRDRMVALLSRVCDRTATTDEIAEANVLMRTDRDALRIYVNYMDLHANLSADAPLTESLAAPMRVDAGPEAAVAGRIGRVGRRSLAIAAALAIAGVVGVIVTWAMVGQADSDGSHSPTHGPIVAVLVGGSGVEWGQTPGDTALSEGASIEAGRLQLRSGIAELELLSGVTVKLEGPATLTLETKMRGYLHRGQLTAHVSEGARGFRVDTPTMSVVDLGTEFGLNVDDAGDTQVSVYVGTIKVGALDADRRGVGPMYPMSVGQSARVASADRRVVLGLVTVTPTASFEGPIELGNLFDDAKGTSLTDAVTSDTFAAVAEPGDLGVLRVEQGGDAVRTIAGEVRFDLAPLGWSTGRWGSIANDAWTGEAGRLNEPIAGISTKSKLLGPGFAHDEGGVGMHANALIVFDLDELRRAGRLIGRTMRLRIDRAGINDESFGSGSVRIAVLVVDATGVQRGYVNGERYEVRLGDDGVWRFDADPFDVLSGDGRFASFDVAVPTGARYLALVAAAADDVDGGTGKDHAVFSGARLEIEP